MIKTFTSQEYKLDPKTIKFDTSMVEFTRVQTPGEYVSTRESIKSIGQQSPIVINDSTNLCEDGRNRVKACIELGIEVKCVEIDNEIDTNVRIEIYNINSMSGKEHTVAQKAILAQKFAKLTECKLDFAAVRFNVSKREVVAANVISGLGKLEVFKELMETGEWVKPDGKTTKSLRWIASYLKSTTEEVEVTRIETPKIDYEDRINTERGKKEFWAMDALAATSTYERRVMIIELLNHRYKLKVNSETGEITEPKEELIK